MKNHKIPEDSKIIGEISDKIKTILNLDIDAGTPILIGRSNIDHIQREHPNEYEKYIDLIPKIISVPDFIGQNPKDGSIEYIKSFPISGGNYVKLAVRISGDGHLFARSLYEILDRTVKRRLENGMLKSLTDK